MISLSKQRHRNYWNPMSMEVLRCLTKPLSPEERVGDESERRHGRGHDGEGRPRQKGQEGVRLAHVGHHTRHVHRRHSCRGGGDMRGAQAWMHLGNLIDTGSLQRDAQVKRCLGFLRNSVLHGRRPPKGSCSRVWVVGGDVDWWRYTVGIQVGPLEVLRGLPRSLKSSSSGYVLQGRSGGSGSSNRCGVLCRPLALSGSRGRHTFRKQLAEGVVWWKRNLRHWLVVDLR